jgi:type VI secretion system FHA domain protein
MGGNGVKVFETGGTIGRTSDNDWVLPDPERFVSSQHAVISCEGGRYFLGDRSTNGTLVNDREMQKGGRIELRAGDSVMIGSYEIAVTIENSPARAASPVFDASPADDIFFDPNPGVPGRAEPTLDPLAALGAAPPRRPATPRRTDDDHANAESAFFEPPRVIADPVPASGSVGAIPENWDDTGFSARPPAPAQPSRPAPVASPAPPLDWATPAGGVSAAHSGPSTGGSDVAGLLRAAGVDPSTVDAATLASLGEVLRVVVEGLMGALKARAEIKNQFRVAMTTLKPVDNNPLKFSVDANDALFNLFGRRNQSFQSPVDAFTDAFDDLKAHQMAMMAGMRAAFTELMARFDPEQLQEAFDRGLKRSAILDVINKTKYWDLYREMYAALGDDDATFRRLFGDEFAQAYEDQMQRLTALRRRR